MIFAGIGLWVLGFGTLMISALCDRLWYKILISAMIASVIAVQTAVALF